MAQGSGRPVLRPLPRNGPARPLTLRPRLAPRLRRRLRLRGGSHQPGNRGGGGGRRHPRVIGQSNRGPRARPRVQSSNEAEKELSLKAGQVGRRIIHPASPAHFPKTLSPTAQQCVVPIPLAAQVERLRAGAARKKDAGNLKRKEKSFPFPSSHPFPFMYLHIHLLGPTFLSYWTKRLERLLYFTVALREMPPSFPETRVGSGVWVYGICVGSALSALSARRVALSLV